MRPIHVIHIPKTGGTALRAALSVAPRPERFLFHDHLFTLADVPSGEGAVFGLRDPIERFVSGFNSRQRRGRPRYDFPWTPVQAEGFGRFSTAGDMAEALSSPYADQRSVANSLIRDTVLTGVPLSYWLRSPAYLRSREADLAGILFQLELGGDFERLKIRLDLPKGLSLPSDDVAAHRNPADASTALSPQARANLAAWYAGDYGLFRAARRCRLRLPDRDWPPKPS